MATALSVKKISLLCTNTVSTEFISRLSFEYIESAKHYYTLLYIADFYTSTVKDELVSGAPLSKSFLYIPLCKTLIKALVASRKAQ